MTLRTLRTPKAWEEESLRSRTMLLLVLVPLINCSAFVERTKSRLQFWYSTDSVAEEYQYLQVFSHPSPCSHVWVCARSVQKTLCSHWLWAQALRTWGQRSQILWCDIMKELKGHKVVWGEEETQQWQSDMGHPNSITWRQPSKWNDPRRWIWADTINLHDSLLELNWVNLILHPEQKYKRIKKK